MEELVRYSCFKYPPAYRLSICINGMMCLLVVNDYLEANIQGLETTHLQLDSLTRPTLLLIRLSLVDDHLQAVLRKVCVLICRVSLSWGSLSSSTKSSLSDVNSIEMFPTCLDSVLFLVRPFHLCSPVKMEAGGLATAGDYWYYLNC